MSVASLMKVGGARPEMADLLDIFVALKNFSSEYRIDAPQGLWNGRSPQIWFTVQK